MPDSQVLTISYGGVDATIQIADGRLQMSLPVSDPDGPQKAIDPKIFQLFGKILPIVLMLFTGGFSPAVLTALIPIIADLFGVSLESAQSMLSVEGQS